MNKLLQELRDFLARTITLFSAALVAYLSKQQIAALLGDLAGKGASEFWLEYYQPILLSVVCLWAVFWIVPLFSAIGSLVIEELDKAWIIMEPFEDLTTI